VSQTFCSLNAPVKLKDIDAPQSLKERLKLKEVSDVSLPCIGIFFTSNRILGIG